MNPRGLASNQKLRVHPLIISIAATVLLDVPFLSWHGLPPGEILGAACGIAAFGWLGGSRYAVRARLSGDFSEEWRIYFSTFPATFGVILQAMVVSGFSYYDTGNIIPAATKGKIMFMSGIVVFLGSLIGSVLLARSSKPAGP